MLLRAGALEVAGAGSDEAGSPAAAELLQAIHGGEVADLRVVEVVVLVDSPRSCPAPTAAPWSWPGVTEE